MVCSVPIASRRSRPRIVRGPGYVDHAFGARGVGELACVPIAPAVAHAYYRLDGKMEEELAHGGYVLPQSEIITES